MPRLVVRLAVAVLVAAAAGLGVPGSAQAATCSSAKGVSVVVDFHELGGGVQTACDAGGAGKTAYAQLQTWAIVWTDVQRTPGFVCRIDGCPAGRRPVRQHSAGRRVLVAVVVRREVGEVDLRLAGRELAEGPGRWVRRDVLAGQWREVPARCPAERSPNPADLEPEHASAVLSPVHVDGPGSADLVGAG